MPFDAAQAVYLSKIRDVIDSEKGRQEEYQNRLCMLLDDYEWIIKNVMRGRLSNETFQLLSDGKYWDTSQNEYKRIIEKISNLYSNPPTRSFSGPDAGVERITRLYDAVKIDQLMAHMNRIINACNDAFFLIDFRDGDWKIDILTGNMCTVIVEEKDPTIMEALLIKREIKKGLGFTKINTQWEYWDEQQHYMIGATGDVAAINEDGSLDNLYGVIPAVPVHRVHPVFSFWDETSGSDLYNLNIEVAARLTLDNYTRTYNAFKHAVITSEGVITVEEGTAISPDTITKVSGSSIDYRVHDMMVDYELLRREIYMKVTAAAACNGVSVDNMEITQAESGIALQTRNEALRERRQQQVNAHLAAEHDLFAKIQQLESVVFPESALGSVEMQVAFSPIVPYQTEKEKIESMKADVDLGVKSIVDMFLERNPDFLGTREDAIAMLEIIAAENNRIMSLKNADIMKIVNGG